VVGSPRQGLRRADLDDLQAGVGIKRTCPQGRAGKSGVILDAVDNELHNGSGCSQLIERGRQIVEELGAHAPDKVNAVDAFRLSNLCAASGAMKANERGHRRLE
jgi:hypothetical protein